MGLNPSYSPPQSACAAPSTLSNKSIPVPEPQNFLPTAHSSAQPVTEPPTPAFRVTLRDPITKNKITLASPKPQDEDPVSLARKAIESNTKSKAIRIVRKLPTPVQTTPEPLYDPEPIRSCEPVPTPATIDSPAFNRASNPVTPCIAVDVECAEHIAQSVETCLLPSVSQDHTIGKTVPTVALVDPSTCIMAPDSASLCTPVDMESTEHVAHSAEPYSRSSVSEDVTVKFTIYRYSKADLNELILLAVPAPPSIALVHFDLRSSRGNSLSSTHNHRRGGSDRRGRDRGRHLPVPATSSSTDWSSARNSSPNVAPQDQPASWLKEGPTIEPLKRSDSAWVPELRSTDRQPRAEPADEESYCLMMEKKVRGLLNKLSPENYDRLKDKFLVQTKFIAAITSICELLVRKSYEEPKYASLYAKLTMHFYRNVPLPEGHEETSEIREQFANSLRRFIIIACQKQFMDRADWADRAAAGKMAEEEYEEIVKIKSKALGIMRFVAELYLSGIMSSKAIINIASKLLDHPIATPKEEDIECALMFLTTLGEHADSDFQIGITITNPWYETLTKMHAESALSSRIKFAIADVLDLRSARWSTSRVSQGQGLAVRGRIVATLSPHEKAQLRAHGRITSGSSSSTSTTNSGHESHSCGSEWNEKYHVRRTPMSSQRYPLPPSQRNASPSSFDLSSRNGATRSGYRSPFAASPQAAQTRPDHPQYRSNRYSSDPIKHPSSVVTPPPAARTNVFDVLLQINDEEEQQLLYAHECADDDVSEAKPDRPTSPAKGLVSPSTEICAIVVPCSLSTVDTCNGSTDQTLMSDEHVQIRSRAIFSNLLSSQVPSEWVDDIKKQFSNAKAILQACLNLVVDHKLAEAALFGRALALSVKEHVIAPEDMVDYLRTAEPTEFFSDIKADVPQLDLLYKTVLAELVAGSFGGVTWEMLRPLLDATSLDLP